MFYAMKAKTHPSLRVRVIQKKLGTQASLIKAYETLIPNEYSVELKNEEKINGHLYESVFYTTKKGRND
jgi:hypothetical protein